MHALIQRSAIAASAAALALGSAAGASITTATAAHASVVTSAQHASRVTPHRRIVRISPHSRAGGGARHPADVASTGGDFFPCIPVQLPFLSEPTYQVPVPSGVSSVQVLAWGGSGQTIPGANGGNGAAVSATLAVTPGQVLDFTPGCAGAGGAGEIPLGTSYSPMPGAGFSNGGTGGVGFNESSDASLGANGGGSSGVQVDGGSVLLVAGGGGGGGASGQIDSEGGNGGVGCGTSGNCNGGSGTGTHHVPGGTGGQASGPDGTNGANASGAKVADGNLGGGGGGGGGGYSAGGTGGGGGECLSCGGGGGGGGASYVESGASRVSNVRGGADAGNGFIEYTWISTNFPTPTVSTYDCNSGTASYTVPPGTYNLTAYALGAAGASSGGTDNGPGSGDEVTANLYVFPGDTMSLTAGCQASGSSGGAGWASGGAGGNAGGGFTAFPGGGGGGASGIEDTTQDDDVQVVAAGGGGAGLGGTGYPGGAGGYNSGGANGQAGTASGQGTPAPGGLAGGASGSNGAPGGDGTQGQLGGGGGGGGYLGGGGGANSSTSSGGGGGEGTSYYDPSSTSGQQINAGLGLPSGLIVLVTEPFAAPSAPTGVSAVTGNQQATVSFTPSASDGGSAIEYYTVTEYPGGVQTQGTSSPITVPNLTAGTEFKFKVTATNLAGTGAASLPSNGVVPYREPGKPVITSATPGNGQAMVDFTPSAADQRLGNPISSYTVTARQGFNVTTGPGITVTGTTSPITVTGLTNGKNYTVTVYATNTAGNGPESAPSVVFPATVPDAPTNLNATNITPGSATTGTVAVSFTPPDNDGGEGIQSYTAVSSPGNITGTAGFGASSVQVTGLTIGTSYTFTLYATNGEGNGPASQPSNAVAPAPIPSPPLVPGAATLDQAAYVSCLPPEDDGGSPIVSYTVTSKPDGITATGSSCPILISGLTDGTRYTFTVTATNAAGGTSQPSQPTDPITPHPPSGPRPANDNFNGAQSISGASGSVSDTNVGATVQPGEPTIQDNRGGASVWFKWIAPAEGTYQFDTCSPYPAVEGLIGAFIGNSVSNLTELSPGPSLDLCPAGEAGSTDDVNAVGGQTIYIKFDGINPDSNANPPYEGPFTLEWAQSS
jgi:trimeric autotransporter adhesin